mmetsp:Transcript_54453/g.110721  ORF Transcript_54453/g.110721 Transcript_54453/m.110721 type:complete len:122 (+) Transcript_54453:3-368(+)
MYYRGAAAAIVVFDVTNPDSFEGAKSWVRELKRRGDPNVVIALAGNKSDIVAKRKVDAEVADEYAKEHSLIYMDTSAKTAHNVKELFDAIAARLPKTQPAATNDAFTVMAEPEDTKKGCAC